MKLATLALFCALSLTSTAVAAPAAAPKAGAKGGDVWVNGDTYHCPGARWFGRTKAGAYMTEAAAAKSGAHGSQGKTCAEAAAAKASPKAASKAPGVKSTKG